MSRPFRIRKVNNPPVIAGMKPYGRKDGSVEVDSIFLLLEEYEAIRLCDYKMLNHFQAASLMNVSRPTLTRIYARARQKIAEALVTGRQIIIEGGKIYFDSEWFHCTGCGCYFNNPEKQEEIRGCPLCGSKRFRPFRNNLEGSQESIDRCSDICICPDCGYEKPHQFGQPCRDEACPGCGSNMVRKNAQHIRNL